MMESGKYFCYNGKLFTSGKTVISPNNRSFRYGDGFFETMKMIDGKIQLSDLHFERLFTSLQLLQFEQPEYFTEAYLSEQINIISKKNKHTDLCRVRLNIFRSDGGLHDPENNLPNYIIQTWTLNQQILKLNETGLSIDVYTKAKKSCDDFSHIKSNNYLPYTMAALWAKASKLDDAILLNNYNRIADTTIANILLIENGVVKTPALNEGCVSGVMRKYVLQLLKQENISFEETQIETDSMAKAEEVFLTNAIKGIQWVGRCGHYIYKSEFTQHLYSKIAEKLLWI